MPQQTELLNLKGNQPARRTRQKGFANCNCLVKWKGNHATNNDATLLLSHSYFVSWELNKVFFSCVTFQLDGEWKASSSTLFTKISFSTSHLKNLIKSIKSYILYCNLTTFTYRLLDPEFRSQVNYPVIKKNGKWEQRISLTEENEIFENAPRTVLL